MTELELRLATSAIALRRLPGSAALASVAVRSVTTHRLVSVYWDTPALELHGARCALRLRRTGDEAWVQTLKVATHDPDARLEYERPAGGERPDLRLAQEAGWIPPRGLDDVDARLRPIFATQVARTARRLEFSEGTAAELSVDRGELAIGDGGPREPILEIEIELIEGNPCRLYELAYRLVQELPATRLLFASKSERGYALLTHAPLQPRRAWDLAHSRHAPVGAIAACALGESLAHLQGSIESARQGVDTEGVHQMRVAVRRLRAANALADVLSDRLKDELRWLWRLLGDVRNWDVLATETWPSVARTARPSRTSTTRFDAAVAARRNASQSKLRRALHGRRFQSLMLSLAWAHARYRETSSGDAPAHSPKNVARRLLQRRAKRLLAQRGDLAVLPVDDLHRLRIDAKKLRYLAEFLDGVYPRRPATRYRRRLAALQSALGALNDTVATTKLVRSVAQSGPGASVPALRAWNRFVARRTPELRRELRSASRRFAKARPFWD